MEQGFVFDGTLRDNAPVGQSGRAVADRAGEVGAHALEVAAEHFHRPDAAPFHRHEKRRKIRERCPGPPEPKAFVGGHVPGLRRPGRTEVANAGLRKEPLQGNSHVAAKRAVIDRRLAAVRRGGGVLHQMGLVEGDHAVKISPQPIGQLLEPLPVAVKIVAEQGIRREQDARIGGDGFRRLESCLVDDAEREPHGTAVAFGIGDKLVPRRDMHVLLATLGQFVVHEGKDLAAFADARAIAVPMPFTRPVREDDARRLAGVDHVFDLQIRDASFDDDLGGQVVAIGDIGRFDARHRRALDHVGRVGQRAPDHGFLHAIGGKDRPFLDIDRMRHEGRFKRGGGDGEE